jgi:tetratricopeptide (TPR) repeat protein
MSSRLPLNSPVTQLLDKGLVRYALGKRDEAIELWQQAIEEAPQSRRARDYLKSVGALTADQMGHGSHGLTGETEPAEDDDSGGEHDTLVPPFTKEPTSSFDGGEDLADITAEATPSEEMVPDVEILVRNARSEREQGDAESALKYAEEALKRDPEHAEAKSLFAELRKQLADSYRAELEPLEQVPYLTATDASILELSLDKIGGFLISQIDGEITLDELLTIVSTFDEFRVLSSLHFFLENGIIELRS